MMKIEEFGEQLIKMGDLDPVYIAIVKAKLDQEQLSKLLLAYWCFYHLGSAAWLSEQSKFWECMKMAALNKQPSFVRGRWPRGAERRHFRGEKCIEAVEVLSKNKPTTYIITLLEARTLESVLNYITRWPLFGPWIAFKAADMLERCLSVPITFPEDLCYIYKEPREGLELVAGGKSPEVEMKRLLAVFSRFKAPPTRDRPCGVQEVETILCKYKSYHKGHYWVGKDIHEIRQGLKGWGSTAEKLLVNCPEEIKTKGMLF